VREQLSFQAILEALTSGSHFWGSSHWNFQREALAKDSLSTLNRSQFALPSLRVAQTKGQSRCHQILVMTIGPSQPPHIANASVHSFVLSSDKSQLLLAAPSELTTHTSPSASSRW